MVYSLSTLREQPQNEDDHKNEDDLKNGDDLKNEDKKLLPPSLHLKQLPENIFLMTSHLDSRITTDVKQEMIPVVQTGNVIPHDKYNIHGIAHVCTNRKKQHFYAKTTVH